MLLEQPAHTVADPDCTSESHGLKETPACSLSGGFEHNNPFDLFCPSLSPDLTLFQAQTLKG